MSNRFMRLFAHLKLPLILVVLAILFVALPAYAGDTPCGPRAELKRGDQLRLLRVWACGYTSARGNAERGRIVMITYRWTQDGWRPVISRFISLLSADVWNRNTDTYVQFGQGHGGNCRIGSPDGSIGCSVPNTHKATFYGPAWDSNAGHSMRAYAFTVSWRDDQGLSSRPRIADVLSPYWTSH